MGERISETSEEGDSIGSVERCSLGEVLYTIQNRREHRDYAREVERKDPTNLGGRKRRNLARNQRQTSGRSRGLRASREAPPRVLQGPSDASLGDPPGPHPRQAAGPQEVPRRKGGSTGTSLVSGTGSRAGPRAPSDAHRHPSSGARFGRNEGLGDDGGRDGPKDPEALPESLGALGLGPSLGPSLRLRRERGSIKLYDKIVVVRHKSVLSNPTYLHRPFVLRRTQVGLAPPTQDTGRHSD